MLKPSSEKKAAFSANSAGTTGGYHVEECELSHSEKREVQTVGPGIWREN